MYVRIKKHQNRMYVLYSEDGSTWINLEKEYDLIMTAPPVEVQYELLQAPVLSVKTSADTPKPWDPPEEKPPAATPLEEMEEEMDQIYDDPPQLDSEIPFAEVDATQEEGFEPHKAVDAATEEKTPE